MKVLFIMLIVVLLVAFAVPVFADKGGVTNDKAKWGQLHKNIEDFGFEKVSDAMHVLQDIAEALETNIGQLIKEAKPLL